MSVRLTMSGPVTSVKEERKGAFDEQQTNAFLHAVSFFDPRLRPGRKVEPGSQEKGIKPAAETVTRSRLSRL